MKKIALIFALIFALVTMVVSCKKDKPIDPCENTICQNGGNCVDGACNCPTGFTGANCQTVVATDPCEGVTCYNGGTCISGVCSCPPGFSGANCQTYTNLCAGVTCYNGGTCVNGTCNCPTGFSGTNCQTANPMYAQSVTIYFVPSSGYDIINGPDLKILMSKTTSPNWDYVSTVISNNTSYPVTVNFTAPVPFTNESWDIMIVDDDGNDTPPSGDETIYNLTSFNPYLSDLIFTSSGQNAFRINQ